MSGARYSATPRRGALQRRARGRIDGGNEGLLNALASIFLQQRQSSGAPSGVRQIMPDKCSYEMSQGAFRKWRRSMMDWFQIARVSDEDAVLSVCLNCDDQLQRALDACYTSDEWKALSLHRALDAIQEVTQKSVNRAIQWDKFFSAQQGPMEPAKTYIHRCQELALDCAFRCPQCQDDMSDYILTHRLVSGLTNCGLKQEILQDYEKYNSVAKILQKCEMYEAAERDSGANKINHRLTTAKASEELPPNNSDETAHSDVAAVKSNFRRQKDKFLSGRKCDNCGRIHEKNKSSCSASEVYCHNCGIRGHLAKYCRKRRVNNKAACVEAERDDTLSMTSCTLVQQRGAQQVAAMAGKLPHVSVKVEHTMRRGVPRYKAFINAVADTGAEVCIMGERVLHQLGLNVDQLLHSSAKVNHAAEQPMRVLGSVRCTITLGRNSAVDIDVLVVYGVSRLYLSIDVCKCLGLVDANFPHHVKVDGNSVNKISKERSSGVDTDDAARGGGNIRDVIQLPFSPQESNVPKLRKWILERFSGTVFNVKRNPLPVMKGKPHHIHLLPDSVPYACHTPIPIPKHWEHEVKKQLDNDVKLGIIRPVPTGTATEWCTRMVVVAKKNGNPRRTVDYQKLNKYCKRETHHTFAPFDMASSVPVRSYKTVIDAYSGFHQVELDEESRHLTTFISPWGRYQYCRTPMGHVSASDAYSKRFDDILIVDIPRKFKCVDDVLLYDNTVQGAFLHTINFLQVCEENGVTLNPDKFQFCQREVDFVGYELGWDNFKPGEEKLSAIKNFPMPDQPTITDVRSWFGLVNQLAPFVATSPLMEPFRDLLKKSTSRKVYWDKLLQDAFEKTKEILCNLIGDGLAYYDKSRRTAVITDWSRDGMGFLVLQQHCSCEEDKIPFCCKGGWKLALCGSRHLTSAEVSYAVVEGEAAAVVWCFQKAKLFLLGCPNIILVTDHRPLVKVFGDRDLKDIANPRLLRLKEKTLQFSFTVKYIPGKKNSAADTLSRYPVIRSPINASDSEMGEEDEYACVAALMTSLNDDVITLDWNSVREAADSDIEYQLLKSMVASGSWPVSRSLVDSSIKPYFNVRDRLSIVDELVVYSYDEGHIRLAIPVSLRDRVIANLHSGHQSSDSMIRRARQAVYWPGMEGQLKLKRTHCRTCNIIAPSQQREPLLPTPPAEYPFQQTVADMFQVCGKQYMAYADRLTGWLEIAFFPNGATSAKLIPLFRRYFMQWGAPEEISLDGGTNLVSTEMADFLQKWGVRMRISSAHYPQSNGRAEAAVRTAKRTIQDNTRSDGSLDTDNFAKAILQYRNTPLRDIDKSPAQLAMGRQLRDSVPMMKSYHKITENWADVLIDREEKMGRHLRNVKLRHDSSAKKLRPLQTGTAVAVQNVVSKAWDRSAKVIEMKGHRQYVIKLDGSGRISTRNRRHLREIKAHDVPSNRVPPPANSYADRQPRRGTRKINPPSWHKNYLM